MNMVYVAYSKSMVKGTEIIIIMHMKFSATFSITQVVTLITK